MHSGCSITWKLTRFCWQELRKVFATWYGLDGWTAFNNLSITPFKTHYLRDNYPGVITGTTLKSAFSSVRWLYSIPALVFFRCMPATREMLKGLTISSFPMQAYLRLSQTRTGASAGAHHVAICIQSCHVRTCMFALTLMSPRYVWVCVKCVYLRV